MLLVSLASDCASISKAHFFSRLRGYNLSFRLSKLVIKSDYMSLSSASVHPFDIVDEKIVSYRIKAIVVPFIFCSLLMEGF